MWMEAHTCSVEAKSQAYKMWIKDITKTQKDQSYKEITLVS